MGLGKGGGYLEKSTMSPEQTSTLQQMLNQAMQGMQGQGSLAQNPLFQQSQQAVGQFLPGGQGFAPIQAEAMRNFQQQTLPSIMNAYGSGAKSSSSLNQALAGAGQNLNTALASQLAQMQLGAAGQGAQMSMMPQQLAMNQANIGLGQQTKAFMPQQMPFWQQMILAGMGVSGDVSRGMLSGGAGGTWAKTGGLPKTQMQPLGMGPAGLYPTQGNYNMYSGEMM
jgi:hypothetical protein